MKLFEKLSFKVSGALDYIVRIVWVSIIMIIGNGALILFLLTSNFLDTLLGGIVTLLLCLSLFPLYTSVLYGIRKEGSILRNSILFFKTHYKKLVVYSLVLIGVMSVIVVDSLYFKSKEWVLLVDFFRVLLIFVIILYLNLAILTSSIEASLGKLLKICLVYFRELSLASFISLIMMIIPFYWGSILYLLTIGLSMFTVVRMYRSTFDMMQHKIEDNTIKYL